MAGGEQRSFSGDGTAAELLRLRLRSRAEEEEREERGQNGVAWGRGAASRPGEGGSAAAHPRRRRTAATWPAPGGARRAPRAGERREGKRAALPGWAEREAGRSSSACPVSLFFISFLKLFLNSFGLFKNHFHLFLLK